MAEDSFKCRSTIWTVGSKSNSRCAFFLLLLLVSRSGSRWNPKSAPLLRYLACPFPGGRGILRLALGIVAVPVRGEVAAAGAGRGGRGGSGTLLPVRCCGGGGLVDASTSTSTPPWDPSERTGRGRATMRVRDEDTRLRGGFGGVLLLLLLHFCPVNFFLYMAWTHRLIGK